jgi:dolichyl-phosphate-mannose--protein O-mannosyl transferase
MLMIDVKIFIFSVIGTIIIISLICSILHVHYFKFVLTFLFYLLFFPSRLRNYAFRIKKDTLEVNKNSKKSRL